MTRFPGLVSILSAKSVIDAPTQTDDRRTVAAGNADATERRGFAKLELGALRALRLAGLALSATAAEGTSGTAAGAATATAAACGAVGAEVGTGGSGSSTGSAAGTEASACGTRSTGAAGTACAGRTCAEGCGACTLAGAARTRGAGTGCTGTRDAGSTRGAAGGRAGTLHALVRGEGVVAGTGRAGALHSLIAAERVVARAGLTGARDARGSGLGAGGRGCGAFGGRCGGGLRGGSSCLRVGLALGDRQRGRRGDDGLCCDGLVDDDGSFGHGGLGRRRARSRGLDGGLGGTGSRGGGLDASRFEGRFEAARYGRLNTRGRALDVFAHFFELVEGDLAVDAEFGGDFVYAWFGSHNSPVWVCTRTGADH